MNYSKQRETVLQTLRENVVHPTAEYIYDIMRKTDKSVSLATLYRNLNQLTEAGKIKKIEGLENSAHYDHNIHEHYHFICTECKRVFDIPADVATKLTKPKSCDDAMEMAEELGGAPQKFTALQYELSEDIRERVATLPKLTWSPVVDKSVLLVCNSKKTDEYGKLDDIIKQNAMYKQAMFIADQQLKQLRRKAVIVINDDRYKL